MRASRFAGLVSAALACVMSLGADWWFLREQSAGGWFSALGDPSTVLPALAFVFMIATVPFFLQGSGRFSFPAHKLRPVILLVAISTLATVSTGWLLSGELVTPAASWWDNYGFPLPWRVEVFRGCPPWCNLPSTSTVFNPWFFAVDLAFFMAIGYALILTHKRIARQIAQRLGMLSMGRQFLIDHRQKGTNVLAIALIAIAGLTLIDSALLWVTAESTSVCANNCDVGRLTSGLFIANSHASGTLSLSNTRSTPIDLTRYNVTEQNFSGTSTYASTGWSGLNILPGETVKLDILVDGSLVAFYWGETYSLQVFSDQGESWLFQLGSLGTNTVFSSLNSPTNLTLTLSNTGPGWTNFTAYTVQYQNGWSNNTSWSGPKVGPGMALPGDIIIDGQAFTFQAGTSYTIRLYDTSGTEWTNYITA